ncbi:MAG TPA: hypothetical protein DHW71_01695 [Gammaproteobacteria bacterium]|nr:hypothetical protein [Gammaproteobacteria bacterium]HBF07740.1 hypothetical protein [Gammaproteobacteria bacterium]HCK91666.1 hypothetical protein [Gammaproteobacteria bacterium]|tara:strand:- start:133 stop:516 length:384 start_codon:yes stop_codon:yes gene_type:complete
MAKPINHVYKYSAALFALIAWGLWAYIANDNAPQEQRIISSLGQGLASMAITLIMMRSIAYLTQMFPKQPYSLFIPGLLTFLVTSSFVIGVHYFLNTPNIALTVSAPLSVAFLFSLYTNCKMTTSQE